MKKTSSREQDYHGDKGQVKGMQSMRFAFQWKYLRRISRRQCHSCRRCFAPRYPLFSQLLWIPKSETSLQRIWTRASVPCSCLCVAYGDSDKVERRVWSDRTRAAQPCRALPNISLARVPAKTHSLMLPCAEMIVLYLNTYYLCHSPFDSKKY